MDQARAVRVVRRDHDDRRRDAGRGGGGAARTAARGRRAGSGARPRAARDRLASDGARARSARARRALPPPDGETRAAALPAAGLRAPRARVRPRPGHLPAGVRGRRCQGCPGSSPLPRTHRSGRGPKVGGARSARRSCSRCRRAGRLQCCGAGTTGRPRPAATARAATGTRGRGRSTGRSRCASSTSRRRCGGLPSLPPRCSGSFGRRPSSTGLRSTATSTRSCETARAAKAEGRRPSASSSWGLRMRVREIAALTLR